MGFNRLVASYSCDWLIILIAIAIALGLSTVNPDYHHFSLLDLSISYPYRERAKVSLGLFIFLSIILPIAVIVVVSLFIQDPAIKSSNTRERQHQRLWEINASLLGLGVSLATATIIFTGVKNLSGKPRPDFLARCDPDVGNVAAHRVGGYGQGVSELWIMVDGGICRQAAEGWLNDGFRSFPSGSATIAFAGLWYLSLYLSARFGVVPPCRAVANHQSRDVSPPNDEAGEPLIQNPAQPADRQSFSKRTAAPPAFLLPLPYVPLGLAIFIAGTRYFDFRNHGFDVLAGSAVGTMTAWLGFRLYHPPLSSRMRRSWGPRSDEAAFRGGD